MKTTPDHNAPFVLSLSKDGLQAMALDARASTSLGTNGVFVAEVSV